MSTFVHFYRPPDRRRTRSDRPPAFERRLAARDRRERSLRYLWLSAPFGAHVLAGAPDPGPGEARRAYVAAQDVAATPASAPVAG